MVVKELNSADVELEGKSLQEGDVVGQSLLVRKIKVLSYQPIDSILRKHIVCRGANKGS